MVTLDITTNTVAKVEAKLSGTVVPGMGRLYGPAAMSTKNWNK